MVEVGQDVDASGGQRPVSSLISSRPSGTVYLRKLGLVPSSEGLALAGEFIAPGACVHAVNRPGFVGGSDDMEGSLSWDLRKCPDELRERAMRMALEALADPARAKGAIRRIAEELGVHPEALRTWVKKAQVSGGLRPGTITDEAQRIKELEKGVRELRRANAILKSASACLSRRSVSARPADLPVHRDQEGGVRGLTDLCHAQRGWRTDCPEGLIHARGSLLPSARGLRDKDPQGGDIQGPQEPATRCWGPARCT